MTTIEQSLREDNDVLRARIREVMSVNETANQAIGDIANECAGYVKQFEQEKKWKNEDPRMLREQLRVADVAFQHLHSEFEEFKRLVPIKVERQK